MKCPKCKAEMEEGMIVELGHGSIPQGSEKWAKGLKWAGFGLEQGRKTKTFRCKSCGYLESYAK